MIWEELKESLILTELSAKSYEDVMHKLGWALVKEGYAKESYIDALISREKNFPTGIDVNGVGIAIPHTDVSHVNKTGIAIGVLNEPVTFFQMGTDDETVEVQLVFMIAVANPNNHIEQLQRIVTIIQDKDVLNQLIKVRDKNEIIKIIREKENEI
ncbi:MULTISPECIES: PTS sugar transporter subunit IIA [Clostridium]|uniref:Putative licABCH operon regulator n=2 Tax=Clostridium TaxID=1485 RepID=A0A151ANS9_9CLOT|nr:MULTISPECIES: PTS sugar transporter subunit IIA [Clostridium]KYH29283.1 putative licABCH operon regulator [Clostridium colicanis DSM 13634]MBE6042976.1 PTS sugar transporter subunit IIA [Clostridium thermopalmarium]PRR71003.1 putative licABCH operon regulator [Clostridium thermopalmarium DSM 5974]PVZ23657.1 PTS system galactitol-specific IIA component [Clostridium thermopalmarium DSM 5974]